jgi:hypothetical protein
LIFRGKKERLDRRRGEFYHELLTDILKFRAKEASMGSPTTGIAADRANSEKQLAEEKNHNIKNLKGKVPFKKSRGGASGIGMLLFVPPKKYKSGLWNLIVSSRLYDVNTT